MEILLLLHCMWLVPCRIFFVIYIACGWHLTGILTQLLVLYYCFTLHIAHKLGNLVFVVFTLHVAYAVRYSATAVFTLHTLHSRFVD